MRVIVVGLIWTIWHIPLYKAIGPLLWEDGFTFSIACAFILCVCIFSIIYTWLFEKDNSVWPVTITHATTNFMAQTIPLSFTTMSLPVPNHVPVYGLTSLAVTYLIVAIGIIWLDKTRGHRLSSS